MDLWGTAGSRGSTHMTCNQAPPATPREHVEFALTELARRVDTRDPLDQAQINSLKTALYLLSHERDSPAAEQVALLTKARDCARSSATVIAYALGEAAIAMAPARHESER